MAIRTNKIKVKCFSLFLKSSAKKERARDERDRRFLKPWSTFVAVVMEETNAELKYEVIILDNNNNNNNRQ